MSSNPVYFDDSYQFRSSSTISSVSQDENGGYITLNQTIFYPQGGGQPYDLGVIQAKDAAISIHAVKKVHSEIRHYTDKDYSHLAGQEVDLFIDKERRLTNMYYHSAGHLLSHIVEELYPQLQAMKGYHYVDGAYVEFINHGTEVIQIDLARLNSCIIDAVKHDYPIITNWVKPERLQELCPQRNYPAENEIVRIVSFGHYPPQPCGGTHVHSTRELVGFSTIKHKTKANFVRISYTNYKH